ncbi:hypothetical protein HDU67_002054 [Dinochytrium kinnereticum]|nr:hypothetical protein HDU67_002054 [Dinochytrium kinnereticum]
MADAEPVPDETLTSILPDEISTDVPPVDASTISSEVSSAIADITSATALPSSTAFLTTTTITILIPGPPPTNPLPSLPKSPQRTPTQDPEQKVNPAVFGAFAMALCLLSVGIIVSSMYIKRRGARKFSKETAKPQILSREDLESSVGDGDFGDLATVGGYPPAGAPGSSAARPYGGYNPYATDGLMMGGGMAPRGNRPPVGAGGVSSFNPNANTSTYSAANTPRGSSLQHQALQISTAPSIMTDRSASQPGDSVSAISSSTSNDPLLFLNPNYPPPPQPVPRSVASTMIPIVQRAGGDQGYNPPRMASRGAVSAGLIADPSERPPSPVAFSAGVYGMPHIPLSPPSAPSVAPSATSNGTSNVTPITDDGARNRSDQHVQQQGQRGRAISDASSANMYSVSQQGGRRTRSISVPRRLIVPPPSTPPQTYDPSRPGSDLPRKSPPVPQSAPTTTSATLPPEKLDAYRRRLQSRQQQLHQQADVLPAYNDALQEALTEVSAPPTPSLDTKDLAIVGGGDEKVVPPSDTVAAMAAAQTIPPVRAPGGGGGGGGDGGLRALLADGRITMEEFLRLKSAMEVSRSGEIERRRGEEERRGVGGPGGPMPLSISVRPGQGQTPAQQQQQQQQHYQRERQ